MEEIEQSSVEDLGDTGYNASALLRRLSLLLFY